MLLPTMDIFPATPPFSQYVLSCWFLVYKKGSRYYEKIVSIKKMINPVKAIIMPRNRGIKDRNALVIDRNVPIIKQNIAKMFLNVTSSVSGASLIFFQCIA